MAGLSVKMVFAAGFLLLMALSIDFWEWNEGGPDIAGMPYWVLWSMAIVIATGIYYILFSKYIWRDE